MMCRYMYDIDNNGVLDKTDFEHLAVKNTIMEGKGKWDDAREEVDYYFQSYLSLATHCKQFSIYVFPKRCSQASLLI